MLPGYERPEDGDGSTPVHEADLVVPVIDGVRLVDILDDDLLPGANIDLAAQHWLGQLADAENGRSVVIDALCGVAECCGVLAVISLEPAHVSWSHIAIGPSIESALSFQFDRANYEAAIAGMSELEPVPWIVFDED